MMNVIELEAMAAMVDKAEEPITDDCCCIYRVPSVIRRFKEDAYIPSVVSIGPFHHNSHPLRLHEMERHKLSYCKAFLQRTNTASHDWIRYIEGVKPQFRRFYSETLEFSKEELVKIIFLDSTFIFELFCRYHDKEWSTEDVILSKPWLRSMIRLDLLLLENQLPFSLLQDLFDEFFANRSDHNFPSLLELTFEYFKCYNRSKLSPGDIVIKQFTDLIRIFYLQHPLQERPPRNVLREMQILPSLTELSKAGVRIEVNSETKCLLDLTFLGGILKIPKLEVEDRTETLLRNMVALEQCHYPYESYITDYVDIMDFLINTAEDVDKLVEKKVLINWLEDANAMANMFNGLGKNVLITNMNSEYIQIIEELNKFYRNPYNKLKSTLRRDYCKGPWQTAATIAGIVLLVFAFVQTVCSILQVI